THAGRRNPLIVYTPDGVRHDMDRPIVAIGSLPTNDIVRREGANGNDRPVHVVADTVWCVDDQRIASASVGRGSKAILLEQELGLQRRCIAVCPRRRSLGRDRQIVRGEGIHGLTRTPRIAFTVRRATTPYESWQ